MTNLITNKKKSWCVNIKIKFKIKMSYKNKLNCKTTTKKIDKIIHRTCHITNMSL